MIVLSVKRKLLDADPHLCFRNAKSKFFHNVIFGPINVSLDFNRLLGLSFAFVIKFY